jgi:hypothetical protein
MAIIVETIMAEDLELGIAATSKTHPSGGTLNGTQISLSTLSLSGAAGLAPAVAWNPGVILAGSQATTTIAASGAALGDKVLVSLTSLTTETLLLTAHVSAANQVTVVLANLTGSTQTLNSGTLSALVFRHRVTSV